MFDPEHPDYENTPASGLRPEFDYLPADAAVEPCVSIVTPFFNTGPMFHETATSVLRQSLQQWEWLIVNDGSTAPVSLRALERYRQGDGRIRVIDHARNRGTAAARNTGFRQARADLVFQLDSDDLLEPTALEKLLWFLESHPEHSFAGGHSVEFGARSGVSLAGFSAGDEFLACNQRNPLVMVRKDAFQKAGGYDENNRRGLEDWDFWLRCANKGLWGGDVPEFLSWYRWQENHPACWPSLSLANVERFRERLRAEYPRLYTEGIPRIEPPEAAPLAPVCDELPCANLLAKNKLRILMLVTSMHMGGSTVFSLTLLEQFSRRGWEVSIATTKLADHSWTPLFGRHTPDIFPLHHFLRPVDHPRFLRYLIQSRRPDVVMITESRLGCLLLPYLRSRCPDPAFVDYCHVEREHWQSGGHPRFAVGYQELLDLNVVSSEHLKTWMVRRGADPARLEVCTTNHVDTEAWAPDPGARKAFRERHGIGSDEPVLLYAARIHRDKRPGVFARVMKELAARGVRFAALVAGDGPQRPELESFLREHGLAQRVRMLGTLRRPQMREAMVASDVLFLPSEQEGIALAIYEAMATGLPVVGAAVGGQAEVVTPECGVLVQKSDEATEIQRYADALADLISNPQARAAMGRRARAHIRDHFPLEAMVDRMLSLFAKAQELKAKRPRPQISPGFALECATQAVEYCRVHRSGSGPRKPPKPKKKVQKKKRFTTRQDRIRMANKLNGRTLIKLAGQKVARKALRITGLDRLWARSDRDDHSRPL